MASPETLAVQRDFYRPDATPGVDSQFLERALAVIEGRATPIIHEIRDRHVLPQDPGQWNWLMNFVGLLALRTPVARKGLSQGIVRRLRRELVSLVSSPENYAARMASLQTRLGSDVDDVSFEEMRRFVMSGEYRIDPGQNWHITTFLDVFDAILPHLAGRRWELVIAPEDFPFVVSDKPVSLAWNGLAPSTGSPGYASGGTDVILPLGTRIAALGRFEAFALRSPDPRRTVALINAQTIAGADRFAAASRREFEWVGPDGTLRTGQALQRGVVRQSRRG